MRGTRPRVPDSEKVGLGPASTAKGESSTWPVRERLGIIVEETSGIGGRLRFKAGSITSMSTFLGKPPYEGQAMVDVWYR